MTVAVYHRVLEDHLVPHGRTWYRNNWLLADDNTRPHRHCVVDAYLHEQVIIHMDWSPYRPYMTQSNIFGTKLVVVWKNWTLKSCSKIIWYSGEHISYILCYHQQEGAVCWDCPLTKPCWFRPLRNTLIQILVFSLMP